MSLINIRNSNGPSTDPCGTPARIDFIEEAKDLKVTFHVSALYYLANYIIM